MRRSQNGFTLVELAMVLFIVSLLLGGILGPLSTRLEGEERKQTSTILNEVRNSLMAYAMVNGHLPCPDCPSSSASAGCGIVNTASTTYINDGIEDGITATSTVAARSSANFSQCAITEGNLPWATLGAPEFDAWDSRFSYRVTEPFADDTDGTGSADCAIAAGVSFQICSTGNITVNDADGNIVAQDIPALVISYSKNSSEAGNPSSTFENENQDDDNTFIDTTYSNNPAVQFDDILTWIPPNTLIYRMVQAERLP